MIILSGKHNSATVYTGLIEPTAVSQVIDMLNQEAFKDSKIRIMPDVHAGKGCTIGTTMTIEDKVVPNLVGVDIGCGMYTMEMGTDPIDLKKLDEIIKRDIPSGFHIREKIAIDFSDNLNRLRCADKVNIDRALHSIGTLGGGNHFIEVAVSDGGMHYLIIHSGSRNLGKQIAKHYQELAVKNCMLDKEKIIGELKAHGRYSEINATLRDLGKKVPPKDLSYLEGQDLVDYIKDMHIAQTYAELNRAVMANVICQGLGIPRGDSFTTRHNYIDIRAMILRKGAVSAQAGETLLIPMNMRDGSLLCVGKGNAEWNYSAPHGAGRTMSRGQAKTELSLLDFEKQMEGIYTTSVGLSTLDEAPDAYKPMQSIVDQIQDTVDIIDILRPIYNYKSH